MRLRWFGILGAGLCLVLGCSSSTGPDDDVVLGGSGTETIGFLGAFVDTTGAPVAKAAITAVATDSSVVVTMTDDSGAYLLEVDDSLRGVAFDIYAIAEDSNLVAFLEGQVADSFNYDYDTLNDTALVLVEPLDDGYLRTPAPQVRTDTMYAPGTISGQVLTDGPNHMGTLVYVPGTSFGAWTDSAGLFVISAVPPGTYTVAFSRDDYLPETVSGIVVAPDTDTPLATLVLTLDPALPPPAPEGLAGTYDTVTGTVCLTWHSVDVADLRGYRLYIDDNGTLQPAVAGILTDTARCCTLFADLSDTSSDTITYQVKAVDSLLHESLSASSVQIVAASPTLVQTTVEITLTGAFDITDTVVLAARVSNPTRPLTTLVWYADMHDSSGIVDSVGGLLTQNLLDTLYHFWADTGIKRVYIDVRDNANVLATDSIIFALGGPEIPQNVTVIVDSLSGPRRWLSLTAHHNSVYAAGGVSDLLMLPGPGTTPTAMPAMDIMRVSTGQSLVGQDLPEPRYAAACGVVGDSLYLLGGSGDTQDYTSIVGYSCADSTWFTHATALPAIRQGAAACVVGEWIYVFGGISDDGRYYIVSASIDRFNPRTGDWEHLGDMQSPRAYHQAAAFGDSVLIIGGSGGTTDFLRALPLATTEVFDPATPSTTQAGPLLAEPRMHAAAATLNGRVYVFGGLTSAFMDIPSSSAISLHPGETAWQVERPLPVDIHNASACATEHSLWIAGGAVQPTPGTLLQSAAVYRYYP